MKQACSGCACWVEDNWSYCMQCGVSRASARPSLNLPSSLDIYGKKQSTTAQASAPPRVGGKRTFVRRRQSSEEDVVRRQLKQWRQRLGTQENMLQELERGNHSIHRAAARKTSTNLRRVVRDGRALVRSWSSSSSMIKLMPTGARHEKERRLAAQAGMDPWCPAKVKRSLGGEANDGGRLPACARGTDTVVHRDYHELENNHQPSTRQDTAASFIGPTEGANRVVPVERGRLLRAVGESAHISRSNNNRAGVGAADSSGWFWGAGGPSHGGDVGVVPAAPGEGAVGAFWRGIKESGAPTLDTATALSPGAKNRFASTRQRELRKGDSSRCSPGHSTVAESTCDSHQQDQSLRDTAGGTFIGIASAKAAIRSARNRAGELSCLLDEGSNAPMEECLEKADSAVRAAQSATSCANELLFELELMNTASVGATKWEQGSASTTSVVADMAAGIAGNEDHQEKQSKTSSLLSHIAQLTEQLGIAQSLQAASIAARAKLKRRLLREDVAATLLQARVRGYFARSLEKATAGDANPQRDTSQRLVHAEEAVSLEVDDEVAASASASSMVTNPPQEKNGEEVTLQREEEGWWILAETEDTDEIGEQELVLLGAIVKLQAIVRSRLARSRTIAAVNARFVEHFDEEYGHPFYVCSETSCSQWTKPFGFGISSVYADSLGEESLVDGNEEVQKDGPRTETMPSDRLRQEAAITIQCAVRAARARGRLAEKIVLASL